MSSELDKAILVKKILADFHMEVQILQNQSFGEYFEVWRMLGVNTTNHLIVTRNGKLGKQQYGGAVSKGKIISGPRPSAAYAQAIVRDKVSKGGFEIHSNSVNESNGADRAREFFLTNGMWDLAVSNTRKEISTYMNAGMSSRHEIDILQAPLPVRDVDKPYQIIGYRDSAQLISDRKEVAQESLSLVEIIKEKAVKQPLYGSW